MQSSIFIYQYRPLILGTSARHLNVGDIKKLAIYVPTKEEQNEIVKMLDFKLSLIDSLTGNIHKNIIESKILGKKILKNAFEGNLVLQDPNDEPAEILLQRIKQEQELADSDKNLSTSKITKKKSMVIVNR